jgi:hypothetical protein
MALEPRLRSAITLGVLSLMMLLALVWGWNALTVPMPSVTSNNTPTGPCTDRVVAQGEKVRRDQVTVSVYNAGRTAGQASTTLEELVKRGFGPGETGNAPSGTKVGVVQIWTTDPENPAVRLVASQLGQGAKIVENDPLGVGVTVVVGDEVAALVKGHPYATAAHSDATICSPNF